MRRIRQGLSILAVAGALATGTVTALPASGGEPTHVSDTVTAVYLEAVDGDRGIDIAVTRSGTAGSSVYARMWAAPNGDHLAMGGGESEWTDTTFRARVELFDDWGTSAGTLTLTGSYVVAGDDDRHEQKFNDGNVHVRMDHTTTPLSITDVEVAVDGGGWEVSSSAGYTETGELFVSNPATYVTRGEFVAYGDSTTENITDFYLDGTWDDLGVGLSYADAQAHTAGAMDLSKDSWDGTFRLLNEDGEELGQVRAEASVRRLGDPVRLTDKVPGGQERWTYTPYEMVLTVDGPVGQARLTVQIARVEYAVHVSPVSTDR